MPVRDQRVTIRHPKSGIEYSIDPSDFDRVKVSADGSTYAGLGYVILRYVTGEDFDGPTTLREIEKAQEARAVVREERAAARAERAVPTVPVPMPAVIVDKPVDLSSG